MGYHNNNNFSKSSLVNRTISDVISAYLWSNDYSSRDSLQLFDSSDPSICKYVFLGLLCQYLKFKFIQFSQKEEKK